MSHSPEIKKLARKMRKNGDSIIVIAKKLTLAKSTVSLWVRNIGLPIEIHSLLKENSKNGAKKGLEMIRIRRQLANFKIVKNAEKLVSNTELKDKKLLKLFAAMIFWCEGTKRPLSSLCLANSDPFLIQTFLYCLRKGFNIDEKKMRALLHLHDYHDEKKQLIFWSEITKIPLNQFNRSYQKKNTKIRKRENYPGCISVRYNDARLARKLNAIYHAFSKKLE